MPTSEALRAGEEGQSPAAYLSVPPVESRRRISQIQTALTGLQKYPNLGSQLLGAVDEGKNLSGGALVESLKTAFPDSDIRFSTHNTDSTPTAGGSWGVLLCTVDNTTFLVIKGGTGVSSAWERYFTVDPNRSSNRSSSSWVTATTQPAKITRDGFGGTKEVEPGMYY